MIRELNAQKDACPLPVVKAKQALEELNAGDSLHIVVGNKIAVSNLERFAASQQAGFASEEIDEETYRVIITKGSSKATLSLQTPQQQAPSPSGKTVVVLSSNKMGEGQEELGKQLMKGFVFALTQLDKVPDTILCYNSGAFLTTEGSPCIEDLKKLESGGCEVLTCGACLNFYELQDKLQVGGVTNMYSTVECLANAGRIIRP